MQYMASRIFYLDSMICASPLFALLASREIACVRARRVGSSRFPSDFAMTFALSNQLSDNSRSVLAWV